MTATPKTIQQCATDATFLHGLLQGLEILISESNSNSSPASNAAYALVHELIGKADRLTLDLEGLDRKEGAAA
ncbi:hypothetical protein [Loktanella sp. R86503]|uniref:hypothetical protein n=1 Tax=Loktanella sp. R86503 TaxID=3093847 RepID=UPI0036DC3964